MNVFAMSSTAWTTNPAAARHAIKVVIDQGRDAIVKIDCAALAQVAIAAPTDDLNLVTCSLGQLVRDSGPAYKPDESAIAAQFSSLNDRCIVAIDASAFGDLIVAEVLAHVRRVLYSATAWPAAVVIAVRDESLDELLPKLAEAFFLLPKRKSHLEASQYSYRIARAAAVAHMFIMRPGASQRTVLARARLSKWFQKRLKIDASDLI